MDMTVAELIERLQQQPYQHLPVVVIAGRKKDRQWGVVIDERRIENIELDGGAIVINITQKGRQ